MVCHNSMILSHINLQRQTALGGGIQSMPLKQRYTRDLLRDYVLILANSGMRVGEANNLRESDLVKFKDDLGRELYGFDVDGKTGKRFVVLRAAAKPYVRTCPASSLACKAP